MKRLQDQGDPLYITRSSTEDRLVLKISSEVFFFLPKQLFLWLPQENWHWQQQIHTNCSITWQTYISRCYLPQFCIVTCKTVTIYTAKRHIKFNPSGLQKWRHCSGHCCWLSTTTTVSCAVNGIQSCGSNPPPCSRVILAPLLHLSITGLMIKNPCFKPSGAALARRYCSYQDASGNVLIHQHSDTPTRDSSGRCGVCLSPQLTAASAGTRAEPCGTTPFFSEVWVLLSLTS